MKQSIRIYLILAIACLSFHSCLFQQDDFFDASSAERATADVAKCSALLKSSPNGWMMEYYVGENYSLGGITLFCKFDDHKVTMASTLETPNVPSGVTIQSLYQVTSEQSTLLTFDSYNELIHAFAAPSGGGNDANANMGGDYEFIIMDASDDQIILQGKKYGNTMVMTRIPATLKWKEYIRETNSIEKNAFLYQFEVNAGGKKAGVMRRSNYTLDFNSTNGSSTMVPFVFTSDGIRFREPVIIEGKAVQHFAWDTASLTFTCTDESGKDVKLVSFYPANYLFYEDLIGNYTFKCQSLQSSQVEGEAPIFVDANINVTISRNEENKSLKLTGLTTPLLLDYDRSNGIISIQVQTTGQLQSYYAAVSLGFGNSYFPYFLSEQTGYYFSVYNKIEKTSPLTLSFVDEGTFRALTRQIPTALVFQIYTSSSYSQSSFLGWVGWYNNYTLEKKQ